MTANANFPQSATSLCCWKMLLKDPCHVVLDAGLELVRRNRQFSFWGALRFTGSDPSKVSHNVILESFARMAYYSIGYRTTNIFQESTEAQPIYGRPKVKTR